MARLLLTALCLAASCSVATGGASGNAIGEFGPWNGDVAVGDAAPATRPAPGGHIVSHNASGGVFNGIQGGAYLMIRFFQTVISPQDGPNCMYRPVCSAYGRSAVSVHGALLGSILAGDRILRCNHFNRPADDPVPASILGDR
jgi:putative membrane protein insertion efficiency factor